jgi:outer membrane protein TolC
MKSTPVSCTFKLSTLALCLFANLPLAAQPLEVVVAQAIENHPRVLAARAAALGVQSEIEIARGALRPKFNLLGGPGSGYNFASGSSTRSGDISAQGVYPLYDAERSLNEISRQETRYLGSLQRATIARDQLITLVTDTYLELVKQQSLVRIASDNVDAHQSLMDKVLDIVQLDRGRAVDATQVSVRLQQAKLNLNTQTNALNEGRAALADLLGRESFTIEPVRAVEPALPQTLAQATAALSEHPSYKVAKSELLANELASKIAATWEKPKVELVGTLNNPSSASNRRYFSNSELRFNVQWAVFDGGVGAAAAKVAQSQSMAAQEQAKVVLKDLTTDLTKAWSQLQSRSGRFTEFSNLASRAKEVQAAYWEQFRIGRRSILDLLNAENEGFQARLNAEQIRNETVQLQHRVLSSMGKLTEWLQLVENVPTTTLVGTQR